MASNSGLYLLNWLDILNSTQLAIDLTRTSALKVAMFDTTGFSATNYSTGHYYATTNEVTGTGYTAGGAVLTSPVLDESPTGTLRFSAANTQWTSSTIAGAACALIYADTNAAGTAYGAGVKPAIATVWFGGGGPYSTSAGTFTIQWNALGIFNIDLTP